MTTKTCTVCGKEKPASGGYWILAYCIDDGAIQVDVLVDAAIGRKADHKYLEK